MCKFFGKKIALNLQIYNYLPIILNFRWVGRGVGRVSCRRVSVGFAPVWLLSAVGVRLAVPRSWLPIRLGVGVPRLACALALVGRAVANGRLCADGGTLAASRAGLLR